MMSERATRLAEEFEEVNGEVVAFADCCSAEEWRRITDAEQWQVGVVCRHIARSLEVYPAILRRMASGEPPSGQYNWDDIHRSNAAQAIEWADASKDEALNLLRIHADEFAKTIRPLTDTELDRPSISPLTGNALTTEQFIQGTIEHIRTHLDSARATVANQSSVDTINKPPLP